MAHVTQCSVCSGSSLNGDHNDCRTAKLNDLLTRIKSWVEQHPQSPLDPSLVEELGQSFETLEQFMQRRREKFDKQLQKQAWENAKQFYLAEAAEEFERQNPDPDPMTFA